ncbi:MAG: hypothetical protein AAGA42_01010 [Actinomycetota bacterium]
MTASTITLGHAHDSEWSNEQPSAHRGWLYAVAGLAVAAVGTIAVVSAVQNDSGTTSTGSAVVAEQAASSHALVQQSIDDALAAQRATPAPPVVTPFIGVR